MTIKRADQIIDSTRRQILRQGFAGVGWVVGEDGGDMQVAAISAEGPIVPLVQITGQDGSEVTGPIFGPSLERLYFSSQRGADGTDFRGVSGIT